MRIGIMDLQDKIRLDKKEIKRCAEVILKAMNESKSELSITFVNDAGIRRLNQRYRKINSRTDVLAFSMREGEDFSKDSPILGDVVISAETAKREAKKRKLPIKKEINLYLIHGMLHLLGYDDEKASNGKKMKRKEKELLEAT